MLRNANPRSALTWPKLASSFRYSRPGGARSRGLRGCSKLGFSLCDQHFLFCLSLPGWGLLPFSAKEKCQAEKPEGRLVAQIPSSTHAQPPTDVCDRFPAGAEKNAPSSESRGQLCLWNFDSPLICSMINLASLNPIIPAVNVYVHWDWELGQLISGSA